MYSIAKEGGKGGLNIVAKRVTEIEDHDAERILYLDMKSTYVGTMQAALPSGEYEFLRNRSCTTLLLLANSIDLEKNSALITCDIIFPAKTHDYLSDFPPIYQKKIHEPNQYPIRYPRYQNRQYVPKLTVHLAPVTDYTCTMEELLIIINLGGVVTAV